MRPSPKWGNYILLIVASAQAVCTGDILRTHQPRALQPTEHIRSSPSFYYHYQQHRGRPAQQIHIEFPQQTSISSSPQTFTTTTSRPFNRFTLKPLETPNALPSPYVEYPVDDTEERQNTSNKLYFEDHNGNDTHREHHYRHVTVNHFYYNATNATDDATNSKGKDVKHHYYYNEYKHDHRNKTNDPNVKHYYNEYKHDHNNMTDDPNVKHHYYYNEYKHDHRNKTDDPNAKHYYNDHGNKTEGDGVKHYYYNTYRNVTDAPNVQHYYHEHDNVTNYSGQYDSDESVSEENPSKRGDPPITDAQGIEDYEYVTPDPKLTVKHHHFKEYHYKNGRLVLNTTSARPPRDRPYDGSAYTPVHSFDSAKSGRLVGFPVIPVVKEPPYKKFGYLGGSEYPLFGWVNPNPQIDPGTRNTKTPNGSLGYYLVDPLGRLPTLRIHASVLGSSPERTSKRVHGYVLDNPYPSAVSYHHVTRLQPLRRRGLPRSD